MKKRRVIVAFAHRSDRGIEIVRDLSLSSIDMVSRYHTRYRCVRLNYVVYVFIHHSMEVDINTVKSIATFVVECPDQFEDVPIFPDGF